MAKRLQVILQDPDYREIRRIARARGMSIAEWVRSALSLARRNEPTRSVEKKLAAIREAAKYEFPSPDIDTMLEEIERGYGDGTLP
jgi:hypothetical protein